MFKEKDPTLSYYPQAMLACQCLLYSAISFPAKVGGGGGRGEEQTSMEPSSSVKTNNPVE